MEGLGRVAIIGAGLIGLGWARRCLAYGYEVALWDPKADRDQIASGLPDHGWSMHERILDAVQGAIFIQESAPESVQLKQQIYRDLAGALHGRAVIASSTSTIMPSDLQAGLAFAERILIGHPFNPPDVLPLVEIVPGRQTSVAAVSAAKDFYASLGQQPIVLHRERLGHLANRLQAAVWREAVDAVASGQASVQDVDLAMISSLGPRWAVHGPFASFHLGGGKGGLAHFLDHLGASFANLWADAKIPEVDSDLKQKLVNAAERLINLADYDASVADRNERLQRTLAAAAKNGS